MPFKLGTTDKVSDDLKTRIWEEYANHKIHCAPWLSLFDRSLFDGKLSKIRYRNFVIAEDDYFLFEVLCVTSSIIKIENPIYIYRPRQNSASNSTDIKMLKRNISSIIEGSTFVKNKLLSVINDPIFVENVNLKVIERLFNVFIMKFFNENPIYSLQEINSALKSQNNSDFLTTMILSFIQRNALIIENFYLKNKIINAGLTDNK